MILYTILKVTFQALFRTVFRARVLGRDNLPAEGPVILAANHMSNWDPPLLACFMRRHVAYMAKEELFKPPILGPAITACHAFPVKRGAGDRGAIKTAVHVLKLGHCLGLFPEGTRSRTGKMRKAEAGVGLIAALSGAPVVPAAILGTERIFANGGFLPKLTVCVGQPMHFTGDRKDKEALAAFSQSILDEIARMKQAVQDGTAK